MKALRCLDVRGDEEGHYDLACMMKGVWLCLDMGTALAVMALAGWGSLLTTASFGVYDTFSFGLGACLARYMLSSNDHLVPQQVFALVDQEEYMARLERCSLRVFVPHA